MRGEYEATVSSGEFSPNPWGGAVPAAAGGPLRFKLVEASVIPSAREEVVKRAERQAVLDSLFQD